MPLLERRPGRQAQIFAEAQSLIDEGLDRALVDELYADEWEWLAPLLAQSDLVIGAAHAEEPSWYFEASLKQRFIEAGTRRARHAGPVIELSPSNGWSRLRSGLAGGAVAAGAGLVGVVALGFVTAEDAAPGDWNYAFKVGAERIDYRLSDGRERVSVQIRQADARVREIIQISTSGTLSQEDLSRLEREAEKLARLAQQHPLDPEQQQKVREFGETANRVLATVSETQPELQEQARKTLEVVEVAVAASTGGTVGPIVTPTPTATPTETPTPTPTGTPEAEETLTPTPEETESPGGGATLTPTDEATPVPEEPSPASGRTGEAD
jgi:hypothetical protein